MVKSKYSYLKIYALEQAEICATSASIYVNLYAQDLLERLYQKKVNASLVSHVNSDKAYGMQSRSLIVQSLWLLRARTETT